MYFEDTDGNVRLYMPSSERSSLIQEVHDLAHETAHAGWECTLALLRTHYYWLFMRHDITNYIDIISLNFITRLPLSNGKDAILVLVRLGTCATYHFQQSLSVLKEHSTDILEEN